jgi:hypothetical protein
MSKLDPLEMLLDAARFIERDKPEWAKAARESVAALRAQSDVRAPAQQEPPKNLPDGWEYQAETYSVVCGGCLFRFGADHPDGDGGWSCPNCGSGNGSAADLRMVDHIASLWDDRMRVNVHKDWPMLAEAIDKLVGGLINE